MELSTDGIEKLFGDYKSIEFQILNLEYIIENLEFTDISAVSYDLAKSSPTNKISQPVENSVVAVIELIEKYEKKIEIYKKKLLLLDKALELLPEFQRLVILKKVIERKPYFKVCAELHISESYAKKVKRKAINNLFLLFSESQNVENL